MLQVRDARPRDDDEAVLALLNEERVAPMPLDAFRHAESIRRPDDPFRRFLAERSGRAVAVAQAGRGFGLPPGYLSVTTVVARQARGGGIGSTIAPRLAEAVGTLAPAGLQASIRDTDPRSKAFAERRGFREWAHRFESVLDVSGVDLGQVAPAVERAAADGVRFFTMAEANTDDDDRLVWQLQERLHRLTPDAAGGVDTIPFEEFRQFVFDAPGTDRSGVIIAAVGDDWVGLTVLTMQAEGELYTAFTGVDPAHQGKGVARALKLLSIEDAHRRGVGRMRTHNLSINEPILALNDRLGYVRQPGLWLMRRSWP